MAPLSYVYIFPIDTFNLDKNVFFMKLFKSGLIRCLQSVPRVESRLRVHFRASQ